MRLKTAGLALLSLALLTSCGEAPKPVVKEAPPEPVAGLHALYQMFNAARSWAPDVQVLRLSSLHLTGVPEVPGKSGGWQATFVSPSLGQQRSYTFAVAEPVLSIHKGIRPDAPRSWSPGGSDKPFLIAAAKIETDQALAAALKKKDAAEFNAKHPGMVISFTMDEGQFPNATWRVIWGESVSSSPFSVAIDASTGAWVETFH